MLTSIIAAPLRAITVAASAQPDYPSQEKAAAMASGFGKKAGLVPSDRHYDSGKGKRPAQDRAELLMLESLKMAQTVDVIFKIK